MECNDLLNVSPNGAWVVYSTDNYNVYRGSLADGETQTYLTYQCSSALWSSDSTHFIYGKNSSRFMLGSISESPVSVPGLFLGWIDAKRFIYFPASAKSKENIQLLIGKIDEGIIVSYRTNVFVPREAPYPYYFIFIVLANN